VLTDYVDRFADILVAVLKGTTIREAIKQVEPTLGANIERALANSRTGDPDPMVACYIDSSYPAMLYFAYKYSSTSSSNSPEEGILASANAGGENVARGAVLGALLGAQYGIQSFPAWSRTGLKAYDATMAEIDQLVQLQPTA